MITMHPGEYIRAVYLDPLQMSISDLARKLGVSKATLSRLVSGKADMSAPMAVRLGLAFGRSAESWMTLQTAFSLEKAKAEVDAKTVTKIRFTKDTGWVNEVPRIPGQYQWRAGKGKPIHHFEVFEETDGVRTGICWRCYSLTDFDFIQRNEGEWRRVLPQD